MSKQTNAFQQLIAMVVELLEDGAIVEESALFADPDTAVMREVDVYALVKGKLNGQDFAIAVECVDRSKKMSAPWVEMIYGKHCRLQVADLVLLVSSKGFYRPAELKARKFGYKTIHPAISKKRLATHIFGNPALGMNIATLRLLNVRYRPTDPEQYGGLAETNLDLCALRGADGSELVPAKEFAMNTAMRRLAAQYSAFADQTSSDSTGTFVVDEPSVEGERLHMLMRSADGQAEVLAPLDRIEIVVNVSMTGMAHHTVSEGGDFDGAEFATGTGQVGDQPSRFTVVNAPGGVRAMLRTQHVIPEVPSREA